MAYNTEMFSDYKSKAYWFRRAECVQAVLSTFDESVSDYMAVLVMLEIHQPEAVSALRFLCGDPIRTEQLTVHKVSIRRIVVWSPVH